MNKLAGVKTAFNHKYLAIAVPLALLGSEAMAAAALPAGIGTAVTQMKDDGTAVFDLIFPVIAALLGLVVVTKLFKRFSNKV